MNSLTSLHSGIPLSRVRSSDRPDTRRAKVCAPGTIPYELEQKLHDELQQLQTSSINEPVTHPMEWSHRIVVAPKAGSDAISLCEDFRSLNKYASREAYSSPFVTDEVQRIDDETVEQFSSADATGSYHRCPPAEESRDLTCFITLFGRFRYCRVPYADSSISDHFNGRMTKLRHTRIVDDTLIYGRTPADHARTVIHILLRCRATGIQLNESKFQSKKPEI